VRLYFLVTFLSVNSSYAQMSVVHLRSLVLLSQDCADVSNLTEELCTSK